MGLIVSLALRGLVAHRLSLALLVVAVAIGVGFQIANTANLAGSSHALLEEGLEWGAGDVRVEPRGRARFAASERIEQRVERAVPGARAVSMIVLPGGIAGRGSRFHGVAVLGVDFATVPLRLGRGAVPPAGDLGVVLGGEVADRLGADVGDAVELRVVLGDVGRDDVEGGAYTMTVRGVAANSAAYQSVFVDRALLAGELGDPGSASTVLVHLADHDAAAAAAGAIAAAIPDARAIDWETDDPFLPTMLRANRAIERVSYGIVVAAISVPLLALFYIRALRRRREIAVLRAIGLTRRDVFAIHAVQAIVVGVVGAVIGAGLGRAAIAVFDRFPIFTWDTLVVRPLAVPSTFLAPIATALATAILAGGIAAWQAARIDPARVLQRLD